MQTVLILDGNQRSALAATRALGSRGIRVVVADESQDTLGGSSRYCQDSFVYPAPSIHPDKFIATVKNKCVELGITIVFPMTDVTTDLILRHRAQFEQATIPFASLEAFEALTDKSQLLGLAQELCIPTPLTYRSDELHSLADTCAALEFPVVLKPCRSRLWRKGRCTAASVHYAHSLRELEDTAARYSYFTHHPFLVQQYITGQAQGVFALYDRGKPVAFFAHRRLRQKPPSGGVSVLSESIPVDPRLRDMAQRLLDRVGWHGVAMVEFKVAPDGTPYLMEVNARFWGSLQLAIDAGVNFPYLLYKVALGENAPAADDYGIGVKCRWLLGDLDHLYLTLKDSSLRHGRSTLSTIVQFLKFFERNTRYEVNRWDDLGPFVAELKQYRRHR